MSDIRLVNDWTDEPADGCTADDWPYPTQHFESLVTGELRDKILAKSGAAPGAVTIHEEVISGGWSSWTQEEDYTIEVRVGDQVVFNADYEYSRESALSTFLKWLDE